MSYLIAALVLVGLLSVTDLLLTIAVIRRLRAYGRKLERLGGPARPGSGFDRDGLLGQRLPDFAATTTTGARISREHLLHEPASVGFFSAGCRPCHAQAPEFAGAVGWSTGRALAIVTGTGPDADELVGILSGTADVIVEPASTDLANRMDIRAFPTLLRLDPSGSIVDASVTVSGLVVLGRV